MNLNARNYPLTFMSENGLEAGKSVVYILNKKRKFTLTSFSYISDNTYPMKTIFISN